METLVELRIQAVKVASSLKDVSSENIIPVASMIYHYIKGGAKIPESMNMEDFVKSITDATMNSYDSAMKKQCPEVLGSFSTTGYGIVK